MKRPEKMIKKTFKNSSVQSKKVQIEQNVNVFQSNYNKPHIPNALESQQGYHITPLLLGKIQYEKMKRDENINQVWLELQAHNIQFNRTDNWTQLFTLLKSYEGDDKYFKLVTAFSNFVTSDLQRPVEESGEKIKFVEVEKRK